MSIEKNTKYILSRFEVTGTDLVQYLNKLKQEYTLGVETRNIVESIDKLIDYYEQLGSKKFKNYNLSKIHSEMRTLIPFLFKRMENDLEEEKLIMVVVENYKLLHQKVSGSFFDKLKQAIYDSFKPPQNFD